MFLLFQSFADSNRRLSEHKYHYIKYTHTHTCPEMISTSTAIQILAIGKKKIKSPLNSLRFFEFTVYNI